VRSIVFDERRRIVNANPAREYQHGYERRAHGRDQVAFAMQEMSEIKHLVINYN